MILERLHVHHLRNHSRTTLDCPSGVVLLWGENGAGKTTMLEAISLLCASRSFVSTHDRTLIANGADAYAVSGAFRTTRHSSHEVEVRYEAGGRKQLRLDHAPLQSAADLIGRFPLVALSPQHRAVTAGGPVERRSFIDFVISQAHHSYLVDLIEYRRILRHRNAILMGSEHSRVRRASLLDPWNAALAVHAVRIVGARRTFLADFAQYVERAMREMSDTRETPDLRYRESIECDPAAADAASRFEAALRARMDLDVRRGSTGIGPHRDDLEFRINDMDVRTHASQGQHKTLLIALKIAEARYLDARVDETPILLFDDVFSELDDRRLERILELARPLGQMFITTANASVARVLGDHGASDLACEVRDGALQAPQSPVRAEAA